MKLRHRFQKHKYNAKATEREGKKFPSRLEADTYTRLRQYQDQGDILFILRQVPFHLPGNSTYRLDFMAFTKSSCVLIEAKGRELPLGQLKRKQAEELYKVEIYCVKKISELDIILKKHIEES